VILGLDPGTTESAIVALESDGVVGMHDKLPNDGLLVRLRSYCDAGIDLLAIEDIASMGMAVGREIFQTVKWIGRFQEAWERRGGTVRLIYRREVKLFLCESSKANDSNIRAAIIDRYGGQAHAIGVKKSPGPLHGIKADRWSALACALCAEGKPAPSQLIMPPQKQPSEQLF
jgi:hypothetical protein